MFWQNCCQEMFLFVLINTMMFGACIFLSIFNIITDSLQLANDNEDALFSILMMIANLIYVNYSLLFIYYVIWKNKTSVFKIVSTIHFFVWIIFMVMLSMDYEKLEQQDQIRFLLTTSLFSLSNLMGIHYVCLY